MLHKFRRPRIGGVLNGWHQNFMWALLIVVGLRIAAAFAHLFYYRDGVMQRMLPGNSATGSFAGKPVHSTRGQS